MEFLYGWQQGAQKNLLQGVPQSRICLQPETGLRRGLPGKIIHEVEVATERVGLSVGKQEDQLLFRVLDQMAELAREEAVDHQLVTAEFRRFS